MIISNEVYENILENLTEGVYYVDTQRRITYWNKAAEKITGYTKEEVLGKSCADNVLRHIDENGLELCLDHCPLIDAVKQGETKEKNIYVHHKNGHRVHIYTRVSPILDDGGNVVGAVELFSDLSKNTHGELITELEKLKQQIYKDTLTEIGNRKYADITLARRISEYKDIQIPFAVFFMDIDNFKNVNDTYGHDIGDKVLKMVANSVVGLLRSLDIVCRWGGEEFVIISPNITQGAMGAIGDRLRKFIEKSWIELGDGTNLSVTVSIGATMANDEDTPESVIKRADTAMYQSKLEGRNRITIA